VILDAHARVDAVGAQDLETLAFFGTRGLVTCAHDGWDGSRAEDLEAHLDRVAGEAPERLKAAGIAAWAALGVHPGRLPWLGLEAVLAGLPERLGRPGVVAVGEVGLQAGGPREEEIFLRQIRLALDLRLPLVVTLPTAAKERILRRTLVLLREAEVPAHRALLLGVDARSVSTVRGLGYRVALEAMGAAEAAELVRQQGPEGLLVSSAMGDGRSDPVRASRVTEALAAASLSPAVLRRVARENAEQFYGVRVG
jgi:predicted metal-dependent TIM-barrel fold hydrolase